MSPNFHSSSGRGGEEEEELNETLQGVRKFFLKYMLEIRNAVSQKLSLASLILLYLVPCCKLLLHYY